MIIVRMTFKLIYMYILEIKLTLVPFVHFK